MKILFVVPYAPTLIRVRPNQLIRALAQQGHAITLATLWTTEEEKLALHQIAESGVQVVMQHLPQWRAISNVVRSLGTSLPLQSAYSWAPELEKSIASLMYNSSFDVVHVEHLRGARYGLTAKTMLGTRQQLTPVVWDSVDCITNLFEQAIQHSRSRKGRLMTQLDIARTRRYEGWLVQQFDRVLVTSASEKQALADLVQRSKKMGKRQQNGDRPQVAYKPNFSQNHDEHQGLDGGLHERLAVVANGVDLEYFTPQPDIQGESTMVFTGKMSYHANVTAALYLVQEIMPRVWSQRPDTTLWIVGKEPPAEIRALASRNGNPNRVVVTGTVADIRPFLQQATVAVAPILYGAGIQNKLLEAMACGTPLVASPQAVAGLQVQPAQGLRVAGSAENFAAATLQLLRDRADRRALGQRGRCYVEEHHAWPKIATQLEEIYRTTITMKREKMHAQSL